MKSLNHLQRLFIVLCLFSVLLSQNPNKPYSNNVVLDYSEWGVKIFGYFAGLNNAWEMFSYAHRDYYRLIFIGEKPSDKNYVLKLTNQSELNIFWKWFFSFREEKFLLNIYGRDAALDAYLKYLCKTSVEGPFTRIWIHVEQYEIVSRNEAQLTGSALKPKDPYTMREAKCLN